MMTNTEKTEKPTLAYVEHLMNQIFDDYLVNGVFVKENTGKLIVQAYDRENFERVKKILDQKLEIGKEMVDVVFVRSGDSWLSSMDDGRGGIEP